MKNHEHIEQEARQPCDLLLKHISFAVCFIAAPPLVLVFLCPNWRCTEEGITPHNGGPQCCLLEQSERSFFVFFSHQSCYKGLVFFFFIMIDAVITQVKCRSFDNWLINNVPRKVLHCICGRHMKIIWYLLSIANQYVMHILQLIFLSN